TDEEAAKLIDVDRLQKDAIRRAEQAGIIFIDEIDKVAGREGGGHGPDVSREGVQRDLLPIVEGSTVSTKYGPLKTDHVLFIAALVSAASAANAADKSPKAMTLAFVLLPQVKLPAGKDIERAFETFAVSGQRLRFRPSTNRSKAGGKPGDVQVLEFDLGAGGT